MEGVNDDTTFKLMRSIRVAVGRHACRWAIWVLVRQGLGGGGVSSSRKRQQSMRQSQVSPEDRESSLQPNQVKPRVPMHKMFTKKMAKGIAVLTLIYVVCCAALFWRYYPDLSEANLKVVEGIPTIHRGGYGRLLVSLLKLQVLSSVAV